MDFEAQNSTILIVLMVAGAAFAGVGLWLLLKPKTTGSSAKIELFGLKFESSSAGLLVFLIGAVFLAIPLFVPEKTAEVDLVQNTPLLSESEDGVAAEPSVGANSATGQTGKAALMLPSDPQVAEIEPNDRIQTANQLGFGQLLKGKVRPGEADWYVIPLPPSSPEYVELKVRHVGGAGFISRVFDAREAEIGYTVSRRGSNYIRVEVLNNDRFYVRMTAQSVQAAEYEIVLQAAPDN